MREPQEILDEEYEQVLERVAAVDVAKASGMVCTRVPHPERPGRRRTLVWEVPAATNAVLELAERLIRERIQKVAAQDEQQVAKLLGDLLRSDKFPRWLVTAAVDALVADASANLAGLSGGQF